MIKVVVVAIGMSILAVIFMGVIIKILWAWTMPELFPGAVEQGLIAAQISWLTAFKLGIFAALLTSSSSSK